MDGLERRQALELSALYLMRLALMRLDEAGAVIAACHLQQAIDCVKQSSRPID